MPTRKIKLVSRNEVAERTMAFHFEKPANFTYIAGQAADFTLHNPPETDEEGNQRSFSFTSAPCEHDLCITTRLRDTAFKRSLQTIPLGTQLSIEDPWGDLTLQDPAVQKDHAIPVVFLTGGIGITAIRSMVVEATHAQLPRQLTLFYSNHRPEDTAFLDDLTRAQQQNPNFHLIATMTHMEKSSQPWQGETGPIDQTMLAKYLDNLSTPVYYISGPPEMVTAMQNMLLEANIKKTQIRTEDFTGY